MAKINFSNKSDLVVTGIPNINKVTAEDINTIKSVVNFNDDAKTDKGGYTGTSKDLKDAIDNAVFDGAKTYQTIADLPSPVPAENTPAKVANDPDPTKNGDYAVSGGTWVQSASTLSNIAVSEDIEKSTNKLIFANRDKTLNSLGYKYIRSDFDFTSIPTGYDNSVWEIRDAFDLTGVGTITLPENSILRFNGGRLLNATITGNNTKIETGLDYIFDTCTLLGTWNLSEVHPAWFGAKFDAINKSTVEGNTVWTDKDGGASTDNTTALQQAFDFAVLDSKRVAKVVMPTGRGITGVLYVNAGQEIEGKGALENSSYAGTTLVQKPTVDEDVFRFRGKDDVLDAGSRNFWFGKITGIGFFGDKNNSAGYAMNFISDLPIPDTDPVEYFKVALQDTSILNNFLIREFPSGGVYFQDGGLPIFFSDAKFLWNNGYGIRFESETEYGFQAVNFNNISGDGNNGGLFYFKDLDNGGSINITNMKSEMRVNTAYGDVEMQNIPIILDNCLFTPITITGATHISSVPDAVDPLLKKKPGDLISITSGKPSLNWSGVAIRVRPTDTGTDPVIISGLSIPYRYHTGNYRNGIYNTYANDYITNTPFKTTLFEWDEDPLRLGNYYFWIDSNKKLRYKEGAPTSSIDGREAASNLQSYTDASLNAVAGIANVNGKHAGKVVWNSSQNRPVYAVGSAAADIWVFADGTTSNTPV